MSFYYKKNNYFCNRSSHRLLLVSNKAERSHATLVELHISSTKGKNAEERGGLQSEMKKGGNKI